MHDQHLPCYPTNQEVVGVVVESVLKSSYETSCSQFYHSAVMDCATLHSLQIEDTTWVFYMLATHITVPTFHSHAGPILLVPSLNHSSLD